MLKAYSSGAVKICEISFPALADSGRDVLLIYLSVLNTNLSVKREKNASKKFQGHFQFPSFMTLYGDSIHQTQIIPKLIHFLTFKNKLCVTIRQS